MIGIYLIDGGDGSRIRGRGRDVRVAHGGERGDAVCSIGLKHWFFFFFQSIQKLGAKFIYNKLKDLSKLERRIT